MAAKEILVKKYVVRLSGEEREPEGAPKGMHRRTFQRLRARAEAAMYCSNRALQPRIRS
jgi:hypothetical protein